MGFHHRTTVERGTRRARRRLGLVAVLATLVLATTAPSAPPADAQGHSFRFDGGGWGHGLGMSQYGAKGMADAGRDAATILRHYYQGTTVATTPMRPRIRVGLLQGTAQMTVRSAGAITGDGTLVFAWASGSALVRPGETWQVRTVGPGWQLYRNGAAATGIFVGGLQLHFGSRDSLVHVVETGHTYRWGTLDLVHRADPTFDAVVDIGSYEAYLYGLGEVPSSWPEAALAAQAVAARTYALDKGRRLGDFRLGCSCTVYATVVDQAYVGYDKEAGPSGWRWVQAVNATRGVAVLSGGVPIQAFYFSSSGGHTENNEFVWGGSPLHYLRGVADPWDATPSNPNHRWTLSYTQAQLSSAFQAAGLGVGDVTNVETPAPHGVSGRVGRVVGPGQGGVIITGSGGRRHVSGDQVRRALGLKSTLFRVAVTQPSPPPPTSRLWYLRNSNTSGAGEIGVAYGSPGDIAVVGDWNGDGVDTPGVVRGNMWYLRNTNTSGAPDVVLQYGDPGDKPVVGDWNGDGRDTPGIVRGNAWYLRNSNTSGPGEIAFHYGDPGDVPIPGDWNGDNVDTPGLMRGPMRYLRNTNTSGVADVALQYGDPGDKPVVGDWNGDGRDTPGIVRGNAWYLRNTNTSGPGEIAFHYGDSGDVPIPGDWNGDNIDTPGVAR